MKREDLDAIARRRCLLVLSVLSGEVSVMQAVEQANISPTTYQHYETRALEAMLSVLMPDATGDGVVTSPSERMALLEQQVAKLEKDKRRLERMLQVTRQIVRPGPVTTGAGRPPKSRNRRPKAAARPSSTTPGKKPSRASATSVATTTSNDSPSTSTPGAGEP
jgi:hypothetical protein